MSLRMSVANLYLSRQPRTLDSEASARVAAGKPAARPSRRIRSRYRVTESTAAGFDVVTVSPRTPPGPELIYLHGGALIKEMVGAHWSIIDEIIKRTGATVTVPMYPLAPDYTADDTFAVVDAVYRKVVARAAGGPVFVAGDSAGGTIAAGLAIRLRNADGHVPTGLFLIAPWLDLTLANPAIDAMTASEVMLAVPGAVWAGRAWAGDRDTTDPLISPAFDSWVDLPPTTIYQGTRDLLMPDVLATASAAAQRGASVRLHLAQNGFHVFMGATFTPEAKTAFDDLATEVRRLSECPPSATTQHQDGAP